MISLINRSEQPALDANRAELVAWLDNAYAAEKLFKIGMPTFQDAPQVYQKKKPKKTGTHVKPKP
jgi:antitoxin component HigA of HigAB toxin-antitoxin module